MVRITAAALAFLLAAPAMAQMMPGMGGPGMGMGGMGMGGGGPATQRGPIDDVLPDVDKSIADDAIKVFERAEREFERENWLSAKAYYQHLRTRFSFDSILGAKAELRLGDIAFARARWAEARTIYRSFLRFYPAHEKSDYAAFRVGLASYHDVPSSNFLQPPAVEKDQSEVRAALQQMREFVAAYPRSEHVERAGEVISWCENRLAEHELYVAEFYAGRKKWKGTLLRAATILERFPLSDSAHRAMVLTVQAHSALGDRQAAQRAFEALEQMKPPRKVLAQAKSALGKAN